MYLPRLCILLIWLSFLCIAQSSSEKNTSDFQVGLVLDLDTPVGRIGLSCMYLALSDFYSAYANYSTRLILHVRDSKGQVIEAASSGLSLLKDVEVDAIIGPQKSSQANFLINLAARAHVPLLSFSASSPSLSPQTPYFVQATQSDDNQVGAIAAIIKAFRWSQIAIIYEDSDYGSGIVPSLSNAFQDINVRIPYRSVIPLLASDDFIQLELYKMMTMQTRVFVVHLSHSLGAQLFLKAKEMGMMTDGYAWIVTTGMMDLLGSMDLHVLEAMQGVLGVKPFVPNSKKLESFTRKWKRKFLLENPQAGQAELSTFGLWAYDTICALAMAAEEVGIRRGSSLKNSNSTDTDLFTLGTSPNGPQLREAILNTRFEGLSGKFHLVNGQLVPSPYQILNVVGKGEREVGLWMPSLGNIRALRMNTTNSDSTSKENFRSIIWPGESIIVPKGWEIPVRGKKLRIAVPVKSGFNEFVKVVIKDHQANAIQVSGYYIDVFNAVMEALPYAVPHEYVPFSKPDGSSAGSYNDLVYGVFLQNYDAAVGDITITANRSMHVDFTLPFAEGGIVGIVPITYDDIGDKWAFMKPLEKNLWLTSIVFFIYTGMAVWILEHRKNPAFRGPPSEHVGKIFYFSFMILVFAQREKIVSNLARLVLVVWMFVVLILSSTYTANLSSTLTIRRLQSEITDVKELIKNGDFVGCQEGSFVVDFLKSLGFEESMIRTCKSLEHCDEALSKGSKNGGISAFFDVIPYIRIFLSTYCRKYMMFGPTYRTDGFAYVFPKQCPLVADVSRAVIELTENGKVLEIEKQWFKDTNCSTSDGNMNPISVPLQSFQGLFAVSGGITAACLLVCSVLYLYENRDFVQNITNSGAPIWTRICAVLRHYDQKDYSSYSFGRGRENHDQISPHLELSPNFPRSQYSSTVIPVSSVEMQNTAVVSEPNPGQAAEANHSTT